MRAMIQRVLHSAFRRFGYRPARVETGFRSDALDPFLSLLKRLGFAPVHIVDVGANRGEWTRSAIEFFPHAQYTLIEPQDHLRVHIQDLLDNGYKIRWLNVGASNRSGKLNFTLAKRDDSSSFVLTPEQARESGCEQVIADVKTLNEIVSASGAPVPEMVKIDAEGLDLRVLEGASDLLGRTEVFLVEAAVGAGFENTVAAVVQRMSAAGYRLMDITDLNRSPKHGVLWLCELAFLRNASPLLGSVTSYE
jgi:FkbM family methyltransferase